MASYSSADLTSAHQASAVTTGSISSALPSIDVIRPEAIRPFTDSVAGRSQDKSRRQAKGSLGGVKHGKQVDLGSTLLLQQAANYASLANTSSTSAIRSVSSSSNSNSTNNIPRHDSERGIDMNFDDLEQAAKMDGHHHSVSVPQASRPFAGVNRFKSRASKAQKSGELSSFSTSSLAPTSAPYRSEAQRDVEAYDPPRLSISSAEESSTSSEVKTPESMNVSTSWEAEQAARDSTLHQAYRHSMGAETEETREKLGNLTRHLHHFDSLSRGQSSPPMVDFSAGLADAGFPHIAMAAQRQMRPQLVDAALALGQEKADGIVTQTIDEEPLGEGERIEADTSVADQDEPFHSRTATIRKKRPATLLRLPSARTDETAHPSPPSSSPFAGPSTADQTPAATADNAYGLSQNPMDRAFVTTSGQGQLMRQAQAGEEGQQYPEPFDYLPTKGTFDRSVSKSYDSTPSMSEALDDDITGPARIASPDSWRSLLPEHDPFFISKDALNSKKSSRAVSMSMSGQGSIDCRSSENGRAVARAQSFASSERSFTDATGPLANALAAKLSESEKEGRRLSSESMQSSFSLPGPIATSIFASSGSSGALFDLDGTFNSGGSRAAFAPLSYNYDHSTKSLASPSLRSPTMGDFSVSRTRASTSQQGADASTAGSSSKQEAGSRRHASFSTFEKEPQSSTYLRRQSQQPLIHPDHHDRPRVFGNRFRQSISGSTAERKGASLAGKTLAGAIPSSPSSSAMGDEGDRESWPSSRNSLQGIQGSPLATFTCPRVEDPQSVDHRLAENVNRMGLRSDLFPRSPEASGPFSTTSTSTTAILGNERGNLSNQPLFATTTTVTTTTTLLTSPEPKEAAALPRGQIVDSKGEREGDSMERLEQSPALPFLEQRPAPASVELCIETYPSHYTLKTTLPGFQLEAITLATKHHHQLVIVADKWDESNGGHFERRVTFGDDANLRATRARFDGTTLDVTVPRRA